MRLLSRAALARGESRTVASRSSGSGIREEAIEGIADAEADAEGAEGPASLVVPWTTCIVSVAPAVDPANSGPEPPTLPTPEQMRSLLRIATKLPSDPHSALRKCHVAPDASSRTATGS
jgi:hypothetical protein